MSRRKTFFMWRDETDRSGHARRLGDAGHRLLRDQKSPATPHGVGSVFALLRKVPRPMPSGVERQPASGSEVCELWSDDVQRRQGEGGVNGWMRNGNPTELRVQQVPQELASPVSGPRLLRSYQVARNGPRRGVDGQDQAEAIRRELRSSHVEDQSSIPMPGLWSRGMVNPHRLGILFAILCAIILFVVTQWDIGKIAEYNPNSAIETTPPLHPPGMIYRKARVR